MWRWKEGASAVGLMDRIAGISQDNTYVEFNIYAYSGIEGAHVDWQTYKLSPYAKRIAEAFFRPGRQFMFDRLYLGVMFYGTFLRLMPAKSEAQTVLFNWASLIGEYLKSGDLEHETIEKALSGLTGPSRAPVERQIRSILFRGRGGNLMNRDYPVKNADGWWLAPIPVLASLVHESEDAERELLADWLLGTKEFYLTQAPPNSMASELPATVFGMSHAVQRATERIASKLGISPPDFF